MPRYIMGSRDQWEFPPFIQILVTVPLHSPNGTQMPLCKGLWKSVASEGIVKENMWGEYLYSTRNV